MEGTYTIPTLDLSESDNTVLSKQFYDACTQSGFFYLKNHGIDKAHIAELFAESKRFFTQPLEFKQSVSSNQNSIHRGWQPTREETLDPQIQKVGDTKESYYIGREVGEGHTMAGQVLQGANVWPQGTDWESWRRVMEKHRDACEALGLRLTKIFSLALGKPENFLDKLFEYPTVIVRLLHYEATLSKPEDGVYGCGAHSDYGLFTFLLTDEEPGLEIFFKDSWHAVPPAPSSDVFIVNLGDMSMRLSNDLFKSTVHRVINKTGRERYSIPLFFEPDVRAVIEPICVPGENPHYAPISQGDYLIQKYTVTHAEFKGY